VTKVALPAGEPPLGPDGFFNPATRRVLEELIRKANASAGVGEAVYAAASEGEAQTALGLVPGETVTTPEDVTAEIAAAIGLHIVADLDELADRNELEGTVIVLSRDGTGRGGRIVDWSGDDLSDHVTADPERGVWIAPDSDPTGASGAWVSRPDGGGYPVSYWGAYGGDAAVDDAVGINAAFAALRAAPFGSGSGNFGIAPIVLSFEAGQSYYVQDEIDATDITWRNFMVRGNGAVIESAFASAITDGAVVDAFGSASMVWEKLLFRGGDGTANKASFGFKHGRGAGGASAEGNVFRDCSFVGYFTQACYYNYAAEVTRHHNSLFHNIELTANSHCVIIDDSNLQGVTSQYVTVPTSSESCSQIEFDGACSYRHGNKTGFWIDGEYASPPGSPTNGMEVLVIRPPGVAAGAFAGQEGKIATYASGSATWSFANPVEFNWTETSAGGSLVMYDGAAWNALSTGEPIKLISDTQITRLTIQGYSATFDHATILAQVVGGKKWHIDIHAETQKGIPKALIHFLPQSGTTITIRDLSVTDHNPHHETAVFTSDAGSTVTLHDFRCDITGTYQGTTSGGTPIALFQGGGTHTWNVQGEIRVGVDSNAPAALSNFSVIDTFRGVIYTGETLASGNVTVPAAGDYIIVYADALTFSGDTVNASGFQVGGTAVVGARKTGWTAASGTADRTTFATYTAPDISAAYVEAEAQAIADHVQVLSRHLKALIDDLHSTAGHGLIGA
jgi:hypothetical protein